MLAGAKAKYYVSLVQSQSDNPRQLWATINSISGCIKSKVLPDHDNISTLVNDFNLFFTDKVIQIRAKIAGTAGGIDNSSLDISNSSASMSVFQEVTEADVLGIMKSSPSKSFSLDPIPTRLIQSCKALVPPLTKLINLSLSTGRFPKTFKHALVTPLIKNAKLDSNLMSSYRPISNLLYISKLLERCVAKQLNRYLSVNGCHETNQSAYQPHHSTETALLCVPNDILVSVEKRR